MKGGIFTKRRLMVVIVLLMIITLLTGCWSRVELNELAISAAIGIDKDKKGKVLISDQIVIPSAIASKGGHPGTPVAIFKESGGGIQQAFRRMTTKSARKIYSGHLQILILSEELAKEGIADILDHITRDHAYRRDFFVVIAKGMRAEDALKIFTQIEKVPATQLRSSLETSYEAWSGTGAIKIDQLTSAVISKGKQPVLTGLSLKGNLEQGKAMEITEKIESPTILEYKGLAVFRGDKLVGWLNEAETKGYNYIMGEVKSTSGLQKCNGNENLTVEVLKAKNETKLKMENGKPQINLKIRVEGNVSDAQCSIDFSNPKSFYKIENEAEKRIKEIIVRSVNKAQKYQADIFGFGELINRKNPKYWEKVEKNWDKEFKNLVVNVETTVKIQRVFKTQKSFRERMEN